MFSPTAENPKLVRCSVPPPKASDFVNNENDIYSEECSELLDKLEEEDNEDDLSSSQESPPKAPAETNVNNNNKHVNLKLRPLELKEQHIETPKNQQKLTTPGKTVGRIISARF